MDGPIVHLEPIVKTDFEDVEHSLQRNVEKTNFNFISLSYNVRYFFLDVSVC